MTNKTRKVKSKIEKLTFEPKEEKTGVTVTPKPEKEIIKIWLDRNVIILFNPQGREYCFISKRYFISIKAHDQKYSVDKKTTKVTPGGYFLVTNTLGSQPLNFYFNQDMKKRDHAYRKIKAWVNRGKILSWIIRLFTGKTKLYYEVDYAKVEEVKQ